eukprot:4857920-Pleurochrysis_carterae.AAC.1
MSEGGGGDGVDGDRAGGDGGGGSGGGGDGSDREVAVEAVGLGEYAACSDGGSGEGGWGGTMAAAVAGQCLRRRSEHHQAMVSGGVVGADMREGVRYA